MHGAPMPWAEVWRILHGHAAACGRRGTQPPGGVTGARTESNEDEDAPRQCEHVVDVAIINGVTGIDARRAELRTAQRGESRHQLITNLPNRMPKEMLKLHKLYLCELEESDGEYRVGLCRLDLMVGDVAHFSWFARKASAVHAWGDTPFFVPYLRPGRGRREVEKGQVLADAFLPVAVEQTVSSAQKWQTFQDGRSIAGSKVRLTKSCMQQLDTFCRVRRPDLCVGVPRRATQRLMMAGAAVVARVVRIPAWVRNLGRWRIRATNPMGGHQPLGGRIRCQHPTRSSHQTSKGQ